MLVLYVPDLISSDVWSIKASSTLSMQPYCALMHPAALHALPTCVHKVGRLGTLPCLSTPHPPLRSIPDHYAFRCLRGVPFRLLCTMQRNDLCEIPTGHHCELYSLMKVSYINLILILITHNSSFIACLRWRDTVCHIHEKRKYCVEIEVSMMFLPQGLVDWNGNINWKL